MLQGKGSTGRLSTADFTTARQQHDTKAIEAALLHEMLA